jgi:hypothetical protein
MDIDRLRENIDFESYNVTTESGDRLVVIEKDRLIEIVDMIVKESDSLPCVSDRRKLFDKFYQCLDEMSEAEYDSTSLTEKCEKFFFGK